MTCLFAAIGAVAAALGLLAVAAVIVGGQAERRTL
jgi:hypothetical protein